MRFDERYWYTSTKSQWPFVSLATEETYKFAMHQKEKIHKHTP